MTALQEFEKYLKSLERRFRLAVTSRGAAASIGCALFLTIVLSWFANLHKFADNIILPLRILLFAAIASTITFALAIPFARLTRRRVSRVIESRIPAFHERLITLTERADPADPFHELLAEDTLRVAREHAATPVISTGIVYGSAAAAVIAACVLCWIIVAGPGYLGYGASLLWTGSARVGTRPLYEVAVQPGNTTIRRKADQLISAQLIGFSSGKVVLHAKYQNALKWEEIPMQGERNGNGYQFLFAGLSDSLDYYVQAGDAQSKRFTVRVKDLPHIQHLRVGLHFPSGLGLKDVVQDPGGDIRAVEGSEASVSVLTDKHLDHGLLVFENGSTMPLAAGSENWAKVTLPIKKDGTYHIAAVDDGQTVRISDDYFIEAKKDEAPSVRILRPGSDPHVSPIEEMPVTVEAADDFGVKDVALHYSINGGPEQVKSLAKGDAKEVERKTTFYLEDFKLAPGDLISLYATAKDGAHDSKSDIIFAQAEPFDFKFRQSQQAGGGGQGAGDQGSDISQRQKEIIAATWNQLKSGAIDAAAVTQNARFLAGLEGKLGEQASALSQRMGNRELTANNPQFEEFSKSMLKASEDMTKAVAELQPGKWNTALPPEQQALRSLLHAESIFRDIQVSFGQSNGGGNGANGQERELSRLLDLELDKSKNQYETAQSTPENANQQQEIDKAMQRLKELAQRQQELAEQRPSQQQEFQQRWEQEQLRREAEQLRQQMQQLAQNSQSGSPQSSSQSGQQQSSSGGSSSSSGRESSQSSRQSGSQGSRQMNRENARRNAESMQQAMNALRQAEEEMRNAVSNRDSTARQRASSQLDQAQSILRDLARQQAGNSLSDLAGKARDLAANQKDLGDRVKDLYGAKGVNTLQPGEGGEASSQMPEMTGPGYAAGFRRSRMPTPGRPASPQEKALAAEGDRLAQQMQQLQNQMQQQAQALAGEQPDATRQLRKALSDAEQQELAERMKKNSEWLRQGYGSQTWPMEDSITAGTEQLMRQLQQAEQALSNGKPGNGSSDDEKMAQALAEVRGLREQMEAQSRRARGSSPSRQAGNSQGSSQRSGDSQGSPQRSGDLQGLPQRSGETMQRGSDSQSGGGRPTIGGGSNDQDLARELSTLRSQLGRGDRQLNEYFDEAIGALRHGPGQEGLLDARINQDAVTSLGRLELELQRRLGQQNTGARTVAPEIAPDGYRDAVASYFRTLSK
ncbi:MAG TPA: DUF4175 family protein [Bryobacteraceae bacterium]|jgi:hypothetical protein|nr:DUF4175 family protein [Bryobacteraceae bacterium]